MKLILAYVIVVPLVQFCLTFGVMIGIPLALPMFWLPDKIRSSFCGLIAGTAGTLCAMAFGFGMFRWLAGPNSFSALPFLAVILGLLIPIKSDFRKYRQLDKMRKSMPPQVADYTADDIIVARLSVIGEVAGILVAAIWIVSW